MSLSRGRVECRFHAGTMTDAGSLRTGGRAIRVSDVRVLTINVFNHHRDWEKRRRVLERGFAKLSPDVVVFQESVVRDGYDQVVELLGSGYQVFHQQGRSDDGGGASIASRWPIVLVREANIQFDRTLYRSAWIGSLAIVRIGCPEPIGGVLLAHHKPTWQSGA